MWLPEAMSLICQLRRGENSVAWCLWRDHALPGTWRIPLVSVAAWLAALRAVPARPAASVVSHSAWSGSAGRLVWAQGMARSRHSAAASGDRYEPGLKLAHGDMFLHVQSSGPAPLAPPLTTNGLRLAFRGRIDNAAMGIPERARARIGTYWDVGVLFQGHRWQVVCQGH
jgi:hypothetical protein